MRIAIYVPRFSLFAGVEVWALELATGLRERGHEVYVVGERVGTEIARIAMRRGVHSSDYPIPAIDVAIAQFSTSIARARTTTIAPIVEVLHSESQKPELSKWIRATVCVRSGIAEIAREAFEEPLYRPLYTIPNPIDFSRFPQRQEGDAFEWDCFFPSAVDRQKHALLKRVASRYRRVLQIGELLTDRKLQKNVVHYDPNWENVPFYYRRSRVAFSYRLSRCLVEALLSGTKAIVYGGLDPARPTGDDPEGVLEIEPGDLDLDAFERSAVAARWEEVLADVVR